MAKKWESNEPQRERDGVVHVHPIPKVEPREDVTVTVGEPIPWEEARQQIIAEREAAGVYDADAEAEADWEGNERSFTASANRAFERDAPILPSPAPVLPELDESEKAYVRQIFADVAAARDVLRLAENRGSAYFAHLATRHGLSTEDIVNEDGSITRDPKAAMGQ